MRLLSLGLFSKGLLRRLVPSLHSKYPNHFNILLLITTTICMEVCRDLSAKSDMGAYINIFGDIF